MLPRNGLIAIAILLATALLAGVAPAPALADPDLVISPIQVTPAIPHTGQPYQAEFITSAGASCALWVRVPGYAAVPPKFPHIADDHGRVAATSTTQIPGHYTLTAICTLGAQMGTRSTDYDVIK